MSCLRSLRPHEEAGTNSSLAAAVWGPRVHVAWPPLGLSGAGAGDGPVLR